MIGPQPEAHTMDHCLHYENPAANWNQALPIGNGRLGAMVWGNVHRDVLDLNEESIWARQPGVRSNPLAREYLPTVRQMLLDGLPDEAQFLADATQMGCPPRLQPYQPLGSLVLRFRHSTATAPGEYRRGLDLRQATAWTRYESDGVVFERSCFVSAPANALVMRLTASRPGRLSLGVRMLRVADATPSCISPTRLRLVGQAGAAGTRFEAQLHAEVVGGSCRDAGDSLLIENADSVVLRLTCGTDFRGNEPDREASAALASAVAKSYDELHTEHVRSHRELYDRVTLDLAGSAQTRDLPTDVRLERVRQGQPDPGLLALYFRYGRYLLISSSRPHPDGRTLPANLQGIWNPLLTPPWESDYHLNINTQMNYWPAETANLPECHRPLFEWMAVLAEDGRRTAREHYDCDGWVAHHISDPWGFSVPGAHSACGLWPMGGAWLCDHLWEHYRFTEDEQFLSETAWPLMSGASRFFLEYLVEDDRGLLHSGPSLSPENAYRLPNGRTGCLCMSPTMDRQIIRELFTHTLEAAEVLGMGGELPDRIRRALEHVPPDRIGPDGRLLEWLEPYDEPQPGHRHTSHLWGMYPGSQIDIDTQPELAEACRKVLERRLAHGGGHTGWSAAWLVNLYARMRLGEEAHNMLLKLLRDSTLPKLFDDHPPFQIDGNFGATAGMIEMLVQSHLPGTIRLLPALPADWSEGQITGICAAGGFALDLAWKGGVLQRVSVHSRFGRPVKLVCGDRERQLSIPAGQTTVLDGGLRTV